MQKVSFVYFDLGGVIELDFTATNGWEDLKKELGVNSKNDQDFEDFWERNDKEINTTRNVNDLVPLLRKELGLPIPTNYSLLMGFVNRFEKNPGIWPVVEEFHKNYKVGLLTNMYIGMFKAINAKRLLPKIKWDAIVDSSIVGVQKPNREIYEVAEEKAGCPGEEILFIDNTPKNLDAAKKLGWQTFLYDPLNQKKSNQELISKLNSLT